MATRSIQPLLTRTVPILCLAALVAASCGKSTPTSPTTGSTPPPTQTGQSTAKVDIAITPNPVTFSGQPITDTPACAGSPNTWFYDQVFTESGGVDVIFTARVDVFDDRVVNNITTGLNIQVSKSSTSTLHSRWCSVSAGVHTAQTTFSGIDANGHPISVVGPQARLLAK
jgi:hypothetical protein